MITSTEVLIVGGGPVGLALASVLNARDIGVRIINREQAVRPVEQSRAEGNHARTLSLYERLGVYEEARRQGRPLHGAVLHDRDKPLGRIVLDDPNSYYAGAYILSQARVERILEQRLRAAGVHVARGHSLVSLDVAEHGVTATIQKADGAKETLEAAYVVGCDGGRSLTRQLSGATFAGDSSDVRYALADVDIAFSEATLDDDLHIWLSPLMVLGRLEGGTWKVAAPLDPGATEPDTPEGVLGAIQQKLDRNGVRATLSSPHWTSLFQISTRRVDSMRPGGGRIFLAGDAAHVHSPMGGQGMNEGMQDALNLAWKLTAVLRESARDTILDSYDRERLPIIDAVLKDTVTMTRLMEMPDSPLSALRNLALSVATHIRPLQAAIREQFAGAKRDIRDSAIVSDPDAATFGDLPLRAGSRAPDVDGIFADDLPARRLFSLWEGEFRHAALLFVGDSEHEARRDRLAAIAREIEGRYGGRIGARVVSRSGAGTGAFYLDSRGEMHRRYGAADPCIYLIRPDGFIAFRTRDLGKGALSAFLRDAYGW